MNDRETRLDFTKVPSQVEPDAGIAALDPLDGGAPLASISLRQGFGWPRRMIP